MQTGRYGGEDYRFGFQGQEMDNEIKGQGNSLNYEYRMHDPRIGRFFAVDPLTRNYPHNSPYAFSENVVVNAVELEGLEMKVIIKAATTDPETHLITVTTTTYEWAEYNLKVLGIDPTTLPLCGQYGPLGLGELTYFTAEGVDLGADYKAYDKDLVSETGGPTIKGIDIENEGIRQYNEASNALENSLPSNSTGTISVDYKGDGSLVWGSKVSAEFRSKVVQIAKELGANPNHLMAIMAFESGLSPSIQNIHTNATGLIQFMPSTAKGLGTTVEDLKKMTGEQQLEYVKAYFKGSKGKLNSVSDFYMKVLWPAAVGKPEDYVLFEKGKGKAYDQNSGLDKNNDGKITKAEAAAKVIKKLGEGEKYKNPPTN
jgi:RHS repeat-associated protein